jgi:hypothetical protein
MNYQEPYRIHQIDFNNLIYTKIKNTDTKKIIFIKYKDNNKQNPLVIQLPSLLNINESSKVSNDYHELEIPLITQESDKALLLFNFFEDLDQKMMTDAKINSHMWFDTLIKKDSIKYKKIVKESDVFPNGAIKIKIIKNNDFETMLQIDNKTKINVNKIPHNYWCKMLIEVYALVINSQNNTFSLFLRPIMLSFKEKQAKMYNYKFLEDSDSDKDEMDVPDSELSSIFIKQKHKSNDKLNDVTSSQIFIKDPTILEKLNESDSNSTSSDDNYEKKNSKSSSSTDEKFKKLCEKSESSKTSSEEESINNFEEESINKFKEESINKFKEESINKSKEESINKFEEESINKSKKESLNKLEEKIKESERSDSEEKNLKKLANELKLSESSTSSETNETSDKIKLTDSSEEEEYLNKIKSELDSIK